jgi:hypothetical protein
MTFRVRWLGFAPDRDTYEPWSSLDSNTILHRYLIDNGMQKLIPPRFRDLYDTVDPSRKRKRRGKEGVWIHTKSMMQKLVATSSTHAETIALFSLGKTLGTTGSE